MLPSEYAATSPSEALVKLRKYGFAVLRGCVPLADVEVMRTLHWEQLTEYTLGRVQRDDPRTWRAYHDLLPAHGMMMQYGAAGHFRWLWKLRSHPAVMDAFAQIWTAIDRPLAPYATHEMLTSMDTFAHLMPPETTNRGWSRFDLQAMRAALDSDEEEEYAPPAAKVHKAGLPAGCWLHTDQGAGHGPRIDCVQGLVNLHDAGPGDATLVVLTGSHRFHEPYMAARNAIDNWLKLKSMDDVRYFVAHGVRAGRGGGVRGRSGAVGLAHVPPGVGRHKGACTQRPPPHCRVCVPEATLPLFG